ncbi:TcpQ domain-containing protein [Thalassobaculum sp.]|uniref:TcpQ domain-containing protein n=1 Tax=Thalassobaculum sp. TaxID=2022740 RepID=UPI0032EB5504
MRAQQFVAGMTTRRLALRSLLLALALSGTGCAAPDDSAEATLLDSHIAFVQPRVEVPAGPPLAPPGEPSIADPPAPTPAEPPPIPDAEPRVVEPAAAHPDAGMPQSLAEMGPVPLVPSSLPAADTEEKPPAAGHEDTAMETGAAEAVPSGEDAGSPSEREWRVSSGSTLRETLLEWGRSIDRKIVYEIPHDMAIDVGGRFEGEFDAALQWLLRGFDRARPRPVARLRSNAVVIQGAKDDLGGGGRS